MNDEIRSKKARQIALLLERANHPNTPEAEAESARSKADALMLTYQIEAALLEKASDREEKPVWAEVLVCRFDSPWRNYYVSLAREVARHVGVRHMQGVVHPEEEQWSWMAFNVCGFQADVEVFEMLWSQTMLEFQRRFEPKYDPNLSDAVNAFLMRMAGMERRRIAAIMMPGWTTTNEMKARTRKVTRLIKEGAAEMGESADDVLGRQGASIKTHRLSYATGFVHTLQSRMRRLRAERGADSRALVLSSRRERINEAFYDRYPSMRPAAPGTKVLGDPRDECDKCKKTKSGYCRDHQWMRPSTARARESRVSMTAYDRGSRAAQAVDLGPGGRGRVHTPRTGPALEG